jgi:hypothetical protein
MRLLEELFDTPISLGTIHNRLVAAAEQSALINAARIFLRFGWDSTMKSSRETSRS